MESIAPPKAAPELKPLQASAPAQAAEAEAARESAKAEAAARGPQPRDLTPAKLNVSLDENAQRFVQTLTDPHTDETVLRYPSETQLAYSRAVVAYLRAQSL
ncbi:MAG: hypothetical protein NVV62_18215 [Terricaulis sp.]|nr:hypothetical protein [Terricaulis sp.]